MVEYTDNAQRLKEKIARQRIAELSALLREAYWTAKNPHVWRDWNDRVKRALKGRVGRAK